MLQLCLFCDILLTGSLFNLKFCVQSYHSLQEMKALDKSLGSKSLRLNAVVQECVLLGIYTQRKSI